MRSMCFVAAIVISYLSAIFHKQKGRLSCKKDIEREREREMEREERERGGEREIDANPTERFMNVIKNEKIMNGCRVRKDRKN